MRLANYSTTEAQDMKTETLRPPTELPPKDESGSWDENGQFVSVEVLMFTNRWQVGYASRIDDDPIKWRTDCMECWGVTKYIKGWIPLPPEPKL